MSGNPYLNLLNNQPTPQAQPTTNQNGSASGVNNLLGLLYETGP